MAEVLQIEIKLEELKLNKTPQLLREAKRAY